MKAWSECTDVLAGLALYWWQRLITFGYGRIRVNGFVDVPTLELFLKDFGDIQVSNKPANSIELGQNACSNLQACMTLF